MMCRRWIVTLMVLMWAAAAAAAANAAISHQYPRSARQAVPYLAYLLESRSSQHVPLVGLLPLSGQSHLQLL
jgi:hypothetical protein